MKLKSHPKKKVMVGYMPIDRKLRLEPYKDRRIIMLWDKRPPIILTKKVRITVEVL